MPGPQLPLAQQIHAEKYRTKGESFEDSIHRVAAALADNEEHRKEIKDILMYQRFLPGGRVQCAVGAPRRTTPYNCFVSGTIEDSMDGITKALAEAAQTMRLGGGIGYDFSTLRPEGDLIKSLDSHSTGPLSFMKVFDSLCGTIASAGHRRGAQMAVLRVDHPDIEAFIHAKNNSTDYRHFNLSVGITDEFMTAVVFDTDFDLCFHNRIYKTVNARHLWDDIMRMNWDWAEPGTLFIDRINEMNNLEYCETIAATNPCGEQPLPPYGACLLGSFNLVKYISGGNRFDYERFSADIPPVVRMMDNIIDVATYPLPQQGNEARNKRRMGLGVTGVANAIEALGFTYGSPAFCKELENILTVLAKTAYMTSARLAKEKGAFPLCDARLFNSPFIQKLGSDIIDEMSRCGGLRNSHLLSIAPTGTISLTADNVSSGIEPVFALRSDRRIRTTTGEDTFEVLDYGQAHFGVEGKVASECTVEDHLNVLLAAAKWVDSAVSKTLNVGDNVTFAEFKEIYMRAWRGGAKGCTTFRASGKRGGILVAKSDEPEDGQCAIINGVRSCE